MDTNQTCSNVVMIGYIEFFNFGNIVYIPTNGRKSITFSEMLAEIGIK
jgi:hypothetical protein